MAPVGDALADQYREATMARQQQLQADSAEQPAYPNVPSTAIVVAEARVPVAFGTAVAAPAR